MQSKLILKTILSSTRFPLNSKPTNPIPTYSASSNSTPKHPSSSSSNNQNIEIRVCTNRTCRKQGSQQILETLLGISPAHISIKSCSCLGRCGNGPNLVVLPDATIVSHCGTPARAAKLMVHVCGGGIDDDGGGLVRRSLDCLALRKKGEIEFERKNYSQADALFSQVIEAKPIGGIHIAYKARSAVRLASGNFSGALEDAREALVYAPNYAEAYICQGDAFLAMDQLEDAQESYALAVENDYSLHRSKSFKARVQMLKEKMTSATIS